MGADMIIYRLPLDHTPDVAQQRLIEMSDRDLYMALADEPIMWDLAEPNSDGFDPDAFATAMRKVRTVLSKAIDSIYGWRRDVDKMDFDGRIWALTGGMSWGDEPTDACEILGLLACLPLTYDTWVLNQKGTDDGSE